MKRRPSPQLGMHLGEPVPQGDMLAEWLDLTQRPPNPAEEYKRSMDARPLPGQLPLQEEAR